MYLYGPPTQKTGGSPPHIVVIVIDDLGWHDAPWNNPDSLAVNLGVHARQGVVLDRHYVHAKCSPSRAALLTGRYSGGSIIRIITSCTVEEVV